MSWMRSEKRIDTDLEDPFAKMKTNLTAMEKSLNKLNDSLKKHTKQTQALSSNELQIFAELSSNAENETQLRYSSMAAYSALSSGELLLNLVIRKVSMFF